MTPDTIMTIGSRALEMALALAAPLLLAALLTGVVIGAFQAATSINEMTLSFIPKLIAISLTLALAGPWMLKTLVGYTRELIVSIPGLIN
jgi:flagellar biosynthesis protein FliQ